MSPRLHLVGIRKSFGATEVLHGVDLSVEKGEIVALLGENGAGKSTLMNIVSGELRPDEGSIFIDGQPQQLSSISQGIGLGIRFVHQELSTIASLSVAENLFLNDYLANKFGLIDKKSMARKAEKVLHDVGLESIDPRTPVEGLGPGTQQLIELAKAIVVRPSLLIMDEPTSSLTPIESRKLFDLVQKLSDDGVSVVLITHKLDEAIENCDRIVVLRDGVLTLDITAADATKPELIRSMIGSQSVYSWDGSNTRKGQPQLTIEGLQFSPRHTPINLEVARGEVLALFGLIGAGRTTFLEMLFGYLSPFAGKTKIGGKSVTQGSVPASVRGGMAFVPEGRKLRSILPQHSVRANITISSLGNFAKYGFMRESAEASAVDQSSEDFGLKMESAGQLISQLSGGNQQKAIFCRALLANPSILLLDEPTHGVDVGAKADIHRSIRKLSADGLSVIISTSELSEVLAVADRCAVFSHGSIAGIVDRSEFSEDNILNLAFTSHEYDAPGVP